MNALQALGVLGVTVWSACWCLSFLVFRARPGATVNRVLALLLFFEGVSLGVFGLNLLVPDVPTLEALRRVHRIAWIPVPWLYLAFIGNALTGRLAALARMRFVHALFAGFTIALTVVYFRYGDLFQGWNPPDLWAVFISFLAATSLFGLAAAVESYRRLRGTSRSVQGRAYLFAFGARDLLWVSFLVWLPFELRLEFAFARTVWWNTGLMLAMIAFACLLTYGLLRNHLFDIDLKIKWTIKKSTLVGIFVGVFFITAQIAQAFVTTEYGWAIGGLIAGFLLLGLNPLQRFAERVADSAMPDVHDTPEYLDARKADVYLATLEEMIADGTVTMKERRALMRLQEQLGLEDSVTSRLEKDLMDKLEGS